MKINCLISVGELIDKISILQIKKELVKNSNKLKSINLELNSLLKCIEALKGRQKWLRKIKSINYKIWVSVGKIWEKERNNIFDKNFIKLARDIYILNDKRFKMKQLINNYYNSYIKEEKSY